MANLTQGQASAAGTGTSGGSHQPTNLQELPKKRMLALLNLDTLEKSEAHIHTGEADTSSKEELKLKLRQYSLRSGNGYKYSRRHLELQQAKVRTRGQGPKKKKPNTIHARQTTRNNSEGQENEEFVELSNKYPAIKVDKEDFDRIMEAHHTNCEDCNPKKSGTMKAPQAHSLVARSLLKTFYGSTKISPAKAEQIKKDTNFKPRRLAIKAFTIAKFEWNSMDVTRRVCSSQSRTAKELLERSLGLKCDFCLKDRGFKHERGLKTHTKECPHKN